jgi:predicted DNA-binding transcriptional regulator YafY
MRKASRLFEIIQILRASRGAVTAAEMALQLGVTARSIYRDILALQAIHVPVEGSRGVGYLLRPGFDLPPLMFTIEETEAIVLALALLQRSGDGQLTRAAERVSRKIATALPPPLRQALDANALHAWGTATPEPKGVDLAEARQAIRDERKLKLHYHDEAGRETIRVIRPIALIYYSQAHNIVGWCELRQAIRTFRADRVRRSILLEVSFLGQGDRLRQEWIAGWRTRGQERSQCTGIVRPP